jgi:Bacterial protein of unknown function (DUF885)
MMRSVCWAVLSTAVYAVPVSASLHAVSTSPDARANVVADAASYDALVTYFSAWRAFQKARITNGAPDYSAQAMLQQQRALLIWQRRLQSIDTTGFTVPQRVDWHIVQAELHGLEFDLRVRRPWATNPAFYVTVFAEQSDQPAREGPFADGAIEVWAESFPLSAVRAAAMRERLMAIPVLLTQARINLTGTGADLWSYASSPIRDQGAVLKSLATKVPAALVADVQRAQAATDAFAAWVEQQAPRKKGSSGVGIANYNWYLRHVMLVPYTWEQEVAIMERELTRSFALLALEEVKNTAVPPQMPLASQEEHTRLYAQGVTDYMAFLKAHDIMTIRPDMEPALRAQTGHFVAGPREFFYEVDYRDPEIMRTHGFHWFDLAYAKNTPHASPIRRSPLLYNTFVTRTEGNATGWEEMMLQAGMFDSKPRSRELIYILLAERAARAMGDLRMHANQMTLKEASAYASKFTPRNWLRLDGKLVWFEQHLYLQQPGYGTSYVIGKIQVEDILATRKRQLGDAFSMRDFMDTFTATGLIPASLVAWEMTGVPPRL